MKRWGQIVLCLLLSASIWLIHNLSQTYVDIVSVPILAESNIDGCARKSTTETTVSARVKTSGFNLSILSSRHKKARSVAIKAEDFTHISGDVYSIPIANLYKYGSDIFGDGVVVESFISDAPKLIFPAEAHKKVPVRTVYTVSYLPQYMAVAEMSVQPDSVFIYGDADRLANIDYVLTRPFELNELRGSAHGKVKLEPLRGVRLSDAEVIYTLDVARFVEVRTEVKIGTRNVPAGVDFAVLPSSATVVFRCLFPTTSDPVAKTSFYIDYRDFAGSISGRCVPHCTGLPSSVIEYSITPDVFDCLVNTLGK